MKSTPVPFAASLDFPALHAAWRTYRSGKRRRREVALFELDAELHLLHLARRFKTGSYRHGDYRLIEIRNPKPRLIAAASVADRVVHTAVYRALAPFFNQRLIDDAYACLPGRGSHRAILRFKEYQARFPFMMHLDIRAYYPHIRHDILANLLIPRLRDRQWRPLLDEILNSGARFYSKTRVRDFYRLALKNAGEPVSEQPKCGLPIGNLTSQWWGNWYLNGLDHFAKRSLKARGYIRYMDDMVFFARDK